MGEISQNLQLRHSFLSRSEIPDILALFDDPVDRRIAGIAQKPDENSMNTVLDWLKATNEVPNVTKVIPAVFKNTYGRIIAFATITLRPFSAPEAGIIITPKERKKGYGREAFQVLTHIIFENFDTAAVQGKVFLENPISIRMMESLGYRRVSEFRGKNTEESYSCYKVIRTDWEQRFTLWAHPPTRQKQHPAPAEA